MFILIDKPQGITSHDVIDRLRKITGVRRVGHAGTLDPMATGLLIVGVGRESTKKLGILTTGTNKTYQAQVTLGEIRNTDDAEGEIVESFEVSTNPTSETVENTLRSFVGKQMQVPPQFSALKLNGKKAYDIARSGMQVPVEPRQIEIYSIDMISYSYPTIEFTCEVSAGTYIRSIARDLGEKLAVGGYLSALRRTCIGQYHIESAVKLSVLTSQNWKEYTL